MMEGEERRYNHTSGAKRKGGSAKGTASFTRVIPNFLKQYSHLIGDNRVQVRFGALYTYVCIYI
jgi:hypothetical protein